jgi:hypothetical protein
MNLINDNSNVNHINLDYINFNNRNDGIDPDTVTWTMNSPINYINDIRNEYYMMAEFVTNNQQPINRASNFDEFDGTFQFTRAPLEIIVEEIDISNDDPTCSICLETKTNSQICQLNCNHQFCEDCTLYYVRNNRTPTCPLCRVNITKIIVQTDDIHNKFI